MSFPLPTTALRQHFLAGMACPSCTEGVPHRHPALERTLLLQSH